MILDSAIQARLYVDRRMTDADHVAVAHGAAAVFSSPSPAKQGPNEDAAAVVPFNEASGVLIVADGCGGMRGAHRAAEMAVHALQHAVERAAEADETNGPGLRAAILNGFEDANRAVCEQGLGAATTLAAVEIADRSARPYHVGDSMILLTGQRGKIKLQTVSHSPVGFAVESGLLDEAEAMHHADRHLVSNVIGSPSMRIEIGSAVPIAPRDTLLLATDGLFDNLHLHEIIARIRKGRLHTAARRLAADAHQRMTHPAADQPSKPDDLTFIAFRRTP